MTSTKVLPVCIQFKWDAASDAANCQTLALQPPSAGEYFSPGSVRILWQGYSWLLSSGH